jgi:uracil-DNA glycosylase
VSSFLWEEMEFQIKNCKSCKLCNSRRKAVPGEGNKNSPIIFIGEGPGEEEDEQGRPFIGKAGMLFTKIFNSVNLERDDVFITNIVKCRPPKNRNPEEDEITACYKYLETQIALINPKVIVAVGGVVLKTLMKDENVKINNLRGREIEWEGGIKIIPIFPPNYLLRNSATEEGSPKWQTWQDMKKIKEIYDYYKTGE